MFIFVRYFVLKYQLVFVIFSLVWFFNANRGHTQIPPPTNLWATWQIWRLFATVKTPTVILGHFQWTPVPLPHWLICLHQNKREKWHQEEWDIGVIDKWRKYLSVHMCTLIGMGHEWEAQDCIRYVEVWYHTMKIIYLYHVKMIDIQIPYTYHMVEAASQAG